MVLFLLLEPFIMSFIMSLPWWAQVLVTIAFWLMLAGAVSKLLFGRRVSGKIKERLVIWVLLIPFRLGWWLVRGLLRMVFPPRHRQREVVVIERHEPAYRGRYDDGPDPHGDYDYEDDDAYDEAW